MESARHPTQAGDRTRQHGDLSESHESGENKRRRLNNGGYVSAIADGHETGAGFASLCVFLSFACICSMDNSYAIVVYLCDCFMVLSFPVVVSRFSFRCCCDRCTWSAS